MKTRKTKKGNSIRRIVAFLLCMTMVLGLGMQDVMEQVYAEEGPAAVQQDVQGTENKENGEQDSASEDPNETPSPTEEGDKASENTPAPESETGSETPSDSETPGQPAGGQGSENGTGDGNTGNSNTGSNENTGNIGNTGNAGNTEQNNNQNTGNTTDGTQGSENGNIGSGNEDKTPAADDAENSDGTKDPNGNGAPAADGVQGVKPTVPGEEDGTGSETADTTEETDETKVPEEEIPEEEKAYEAEQKVDNVTIHVSADAGVLPADAELSVTPIVKTEITDDMSEEEKAEAEKINAQYDETEQKLAEDIESKTETVPDEAADVSEDAVVLSVNDPADAAAEDDSADSRKVLAGFLAYDISFFVMDEEGNESEIEPDGEVEVTFEFDEAVLPESVPQDAEVSVAHLKEEDTESGKEIVVEDMTAAENATVEKTEKAEVTKVELTTDSFSTFTICWYDYYERESLDIRVVDSNGTIIGEDQETELFVDREYTVNEIAGMITVPEGYAFSKAVIGWKFESADIEVAKLKCSKVEEGYFDYYVNQYLANEGYQFQNIGYNTVWFIYNNDVLNTVETLDNANHGITMTMKDLDKSAQDRVLGNYGEQVTVQGGDTYYNVEQGIVNEQLGKDGFPTLTGTHDRTQGTSLSSLFSDGRTVNHLLLKSEYDATGYFEYSSFNNFAHLKDDGDFTVYDAIGTPGNKENDRYYFKRGNFLPYNDIEQGQYSIHSNEYGPDGQKLQEGDTGYGKRLYLVGDGSTLADGNYNVNYNFAFTMEANFYQPKDGKVEFKGQTNDMIYEFNGDDDLWIYIDDVLVLDIGGTHDAHTGTINFATGEVEVNKGPDRNGNDQIVKTTIREMYEKAQIFPDGSEWVNANVDRYFDGNTYVDYSSHNLKMFYMERGKWASNLYMRFNLQTIPEGNVIVEKQLGVTGTALDNETFTFKAETSTNKQDWVALPEGTQYTIMTSNGDFVDTGSIGENGNFSLQAGQRAVFSNMTAGTYFRATETSNGSYATEVHAYGEDYYVIEKTGQLQVSGGSNYVLFINTPDSSSLLNYDKNTEATDCDDRVYKVNLSAGTLGSTSGTEGDSASIVMLLDASSSLGDNAFGELKKAATGFIDTVASKASGPNSGKTEIAVVWYYGSQKPHPEFSHGDFDEKIDSSGFKSVNTSSGVQALKSHLAKIKAPSGGTPMGSALETAENLLQTSNSTHKYVLMFTDGRPGHSDPNSEEIIRWNCMVANDAWTHANNIKEAGGTIYTVGYGKDLEENLTWCPEDPGDSYKQNHKCDDRQWNSYKREYDYPHRIETKGSEFLTNYIADPGCSFITNDSADFDDIFQSIAGSMGSNLTTQTEKIVDVVDPRFNLLVMTTEQDDAIWNDGEGNYYCIAKDGDKIADNVGNKGVVTCDPNTQSYTITWNEVVIANTDDSGWSASFYVKAKEDFIGGNVIPTNTTDSGIYLPGDEIIRFPMPTVNVKLLTLNSENKEVTYFKGETVTPEDFIEKLFDTAKVEELVSQNKTPVTLKLSDIVGSFTEEQINTLLQGGTVSVNYSYQGTNDVVGVFEFSLSTEPQETEWTEHRLDTVGDEAEKYILNIWYTARTKDEREEAHTGWESPVCNEVSNVSTAPTYTVKVVAGSITIQKTLSVEELETALDASDNGEVTFTFNIEGEKGRYNPPYEARQVMITFNRADINGLDPDTLEITKTADAATELAQDIYTVSEVVTPGFEPEDVIADGLSTSRTPVKDAVADKESMTATVYVGLDKDESSDKEYLNYRDGVVTFKNGMVMNDWQIVKVSSSNSSVKLGGAKFELTSQTGEDVRYTGESADETGVITWKDGKGQDVAYLKQGIYTLKEIEAPSNYLLSNEEWTVEISASGALVSIKNGEETLPPVTGEDGKVTYSFTNELLYDLPSAGGPGIYLYMLGGTMLMMAGALLVYKKRKEEVLRS